MDYKELIEELRKPMLVDGSYLVDHSRRDSATAITDLLARVEAAEHLLQEVKEQRDYCREKCDVAEKNYQIEMERRKSAEYRARKAEQERDAAVSDLETIMAYGGSGLDTCEFCKNGQCYARGGIKPCLPKWRG